MPRTATTGKRYPLNIQTTKQLRQQLEAAARASGRSLAQEVEARLTQSLRDDIIELKLDCLNQNFINMAETLADWLDANEGAARSDFPASERNFTS